MSIIPDGCLADLRTAISEFVVDTATVARTGATVNVRVSPLSADVRVHMPRPELQQEPEWKLIFLDAADIRVGDVVTTVDPTPYAGTYLVIKLGNPQTYSVSTTTYATAWGDPVLCSTLREPDALQIGQVLDFGTQLATLTARTFMGTFLHPAGSSFVADSFGVSLVQPAKIYCDWPTGATDPFPVRAKDILIDPTGVAYVVEAVESRIGLWLILYVDVATE